jgi:hypothetical protein
MLDSAKTVISVTIGTAVALLILLAIGAATHPGATGITAVGDGIAQVIKVAVELITASVKAIAAI